MPALLAVRYFSVSFSVAPHLLDFIMYRFQFIGMMAPLAIPPPPVPGWGGHCV